MSTLTVTARGQVTLRKEVLQHLGVGSGERRCDPLFSSIFPRQQDCGGGAIRLGDQPYRQRPRYDVAG